MSQLSSMSRALETTFQAVLTAAAPLAGVSIRRSNEAVPADPAAVRVPAVIVAAVKREEWQTIRVAGRSGELCGLKLECRHSSDTAVEALAQTVLTAVNAATIASGWLFLQLAPEAEERSFDGPTRILALNFAAFVLTAP